MPNFTILSEGFYTEKNSKFYCIISKINSLEEIRNLLRVAKKDYAKAKHIIYAFRLNESNSSASENGEPIRSAHKIQFILQRKCLSNIIIIIIRFYGGVKLGANNLEKAYMQAFFDAFKKLNNDLLG